MSGVRDLDGRELDAAVAREILGRDVDWRREDGGRVLLIVDGDEPSPCPRYSSDAGAARALERELDRRGLDEAYVDHLLKQERPQLGIVDTLEYRDVWNILHAGPARRCRAALTVWREERAGEAGRPPGEEA